MDKFNVPRRLDNPKRVLRGVRETYNLTNLGYSLYGARRFEDAITACREAALLHHDTRDELREVDALINLAFPPARGTTVRQCHHRLPNCHHHLPPTRRSQPRS